ncbi:CATRA conflict system CASPASE/TPR repeat-associated protein [Nonomuraea dietziae]|uniref:Uncharacterized protein n=1 Tax=Nonomuraea dietziae TaxID=65515 RepID=A0A7W5YUH3_9ACTN|nr:CATRA conflict system CASPASE/TPR repeat-associated protein [Nonomuraea dietziae]MBB3733284.1 hypothetical protein [Nonomuraea dietziae]
MDERALVVHVFAPVSGCGEQLTALWERLGEGLGMTWSIPELGPYRLDLDEPPRGPVLAARRSRSREEIVEAVVRRRHDALALTVGMSPPARDGVDWRELEERWTRTADDLPAWALGEARLFTGVAPDLTAPPSEAPHGFPLSQLEGTALLVDGHTAVWEQQGADDRLTRRLLVISAVRRQDDSEAWMWTPGGASVPPLTLHLLHAAKVRHQLRQRDRFDADEVLRRADETLRERHRASSDDPAERLLEVRRRLSGLLSGPDGLTWATTLLREMERTVRIAEANLRPSTRLAATPGPFRDDLELAAWLGQRLDDDLLYLEAARERVRDGLTEAVQAAEEAVQDRRERLQRRQEELQRHRERLNLLQAAVVGAALMVLAAIQAFGYRVPLPGSVTPAVIATLGSLALLLATVTLWTAGEPGAPAQRWTRLAIRGSAGMACAALAWVGCALAFHLATGTAAPPVWTAGLAAPAFVLGAWAVRLR